MLLKVLETFPSISTDVASEQKIIKYSVDSFFTQQVLRVT